MHDRYSQRHEASNTMQRLPRKMNLSLGALAALFTFGTAATAQAQDVNVLRRNQPDYHVVESGDTLYDLSAQYLGDTYEWPKLWAYNPHITNPHWIYPGDIVYLKDAVEVPAESSGKPNRIRQSRQVKSELFVATVGFTTDEEIKYVGRIVASPKQANMLAELDTAWIGFGEDGYTPKERDTMGDSEMTALENPENEVKVGDRFAIVRKVGTITDEGDEEKVVGTKYLMLGTLRVTEIKDKYLDVAEITQSWREIQRGDLLIPYEQQLKQVSPTKADRNMVATVSDVINPIQVIGEHQYAMVNKGAEDGLRPGYRFFAYQRDEGLRPQLEASDDQIPYTLVGQLMIIDVREHFSTAIVIDSKREIFVGDRLEMYEGS